MRFTPATFQTKAEMLASERKSEFAAVLETSEIYKLNSAGEYEFLSKFSMAPATPPTLPQQAASLGKALVNWTSSGFAPTPPDILTAREAICRACPEWDAQALNNTGRCRKCGCSTWAKLRMATERCPIGKWEAAEPRPETGALKPET
jgi:predicted Zn-ribbon and HTH transcriptional regulator